MLRLLLIALFLISIFSASYTLPSTVYAYTCSVAPVEGSATEDSVRMRISFSDANAVGDFTTNLIYQDEVPIPGIREDSTMIKDDATGAISFEYVYSGLTHPANEYRVEADNKSASTGFTRVPCEGATTTDTGAVDVDPGGNETDGPSAYCYDHTNPIIYNSQECRDLRNDPVPAPAAPAEKDPCADKTGADKQSCEAEEACNTEANKKAGKVFARAFNNACVTLPEFIETVVNYVMMFAALIAGFMFLQGGIKIISSRGNPAAVVEARSTLLNASIGLVLLATSYVIIQFLSGAFGSGVSNDINLLGPLVP